MEKNNNKMEAQSRAEELKRVEKIANGKIPVSEESPIYRHFYERRYKCDRALKGDYSPEQLDLIFLDIEYIENDIKKYLGL